MVEKSPDSAAPQLRCLRDTHLWRAALTCRPSWARGASSRSTGPPGRLARIMCASAPRCLHVEGPDSLGESDLGSPAQRWAREAQSPWQDWASLTHFVSKPAGFLSGGSGKGQAHLSAVMPGGQWRHWPGLTDSPCSSSGQTELSAWSSPGTLPLGVPASPASWPCLRAALLWVTHCL